MRDRSGDSVIKQVAAFSSGRDVMPSLRVLRSLRSYAAIECSDWLASATCLSACSSISGSSLPLFPARRRIPAHAFALK
jgi:hypothetical protein